MIRTTVTYLDALRAALHVNSDAAVAAALNVSRQTISSYRLRGTCMDDDVAARAAALLGIQPATILLDMYAERTRDPAIKRLWEHIGSTYQETHPDALHA